MKNFNQWFKEKKLYFEAEEFEAEEVGQWFPVQKRPDIKLYVLPVEEIIQMAGETKELQNPIVPELILQVNPDGQSVKLRSLEKVQIANPGDYVTVAQTGAWWQQKAKNLEDSKRNQKETGNFRGWQIFTPLGKGFAQIQPSAGTEHTSWGDLPYEAGDVIIADDLNGKTGRRPVKKEEFEKTWQRIG